MMIKAVCFDLGDTLVAEETVTYNSLGQAVNAEVIDGAFEILENLRKMGYRLALIANDDSIGARNIISANGLEDKFAAIIISEEIGIEKPDGRIFTTALDKLGVEPENAVMVGNRIDTDIVGANRLGMKSIQFKWNNRYNNSMDSEEEKPDFIVESLFELPGILRAFSDLSP